MALYASAAEIKEQAEAADASSDAVWTSLASAVSRLFDRVSDVSNDFYKPAEAAASELVFIPNNSKYLRLPPFIKDSLAQVLIDEDISTKFKLKDGYLIFNAIQTEDQIIKITARFGFEDIPADVKQACIEQALLMWRRKDLNFTEIAGVSSAAVNNPFSPTFEIVAEKYRNDFGNFNYFA